MPKLINSHHNGAIVRALHPGDVAIARHPGSKVIDTDMRAVDFFSASSIALAGH